jgi:hypothetical protein
MINQGSNEKSFSELIEESFVLFTEDNSNNEGRKDQNEGQSTTFPNTMRRDGFMKVESRSTKR